ncbi:hypothetical protein J7E93_06560 [Streptomyces sp. ISL-36]|nr:hypothetical protein [Streptomyces sp. ISL-36]
MEVVQLLLEFLGARRVVHSRCGFFMSQPGARTMRPAAVSRRLVSASSSQKRVEPHRQTTVGRSDGYWTGSERSTAAAVAPSVIWLVWVRRAAAC